MCLIGLSIAFLLIMWGIYNAGVIKKGFLAPILLFCFGLGGMFGIITFVSGLAMPLGMVLFGPLGDAVKIEWLLIVTGIMLIIGGFILYGRRELVQIGAAQTLPNTEGLNA